MSLTMDVATHNNKNGTWLRDEDGFYEWEGVKYPSVTTILKVVGKPSLLFWAANEVAKAATEWWADESQYRYTNDCTFPGYDALRNAPWNYRDAKAAIGTATHDVLERTAKGLPVDLGSLPDDVRPYAESALAWVEESKPTFLLTERACFHPRYKYAGTFDAVVELDGRLLMLDYKTSKDTYEDHAMQLAAYRYSEFVGCDDGTILPTPQVDGGAILVIQPDRARLYEWDCSLDVYDSFLNVKELYDWKAGKPRPTLLNRKKRGKKEAA